MRVKAADKLLLQVLFTLTGAALGAIAVAALVVVLRGWHIWHVPPITATLSSLGGAGIFGAFWLLLWRLGPSNEPTVLSPARRRALLLAMALFIVTAGCLVAFTFAGAPGPLLQQATFPGVLGFMFITHGISAVLIVEVARTTTRRMSRWSDRQHFGGVGVVWALFSTLGAFLLWREWQKLTWP